MSPIASVIDFNVHRSVRMGRCATLEFMLERGADPNATPVDNGPPPLRMCRPDKDEGHMKCFVLLLRYGANPYLAFDLWDFRFLSYTERCFSYLIVELVCGEADDLHVDIWRVVKPFIYNI